MMQTSEGLPGPNGLQGLKAGEIHLWLAVATRIPAAGAASALEALNLGEARAATRFHLEADRHRDRIARLLVRTTLSHYLPVRADAWVIDRAASGRPEIIAPCPGDLVFSLSHTRELIVCAITARGELGVDCESLRGPAPLEVAALAFSADEQRELWALPLADRHRRFYERWTLKEAYAKARGLGLTLPFEGITFALPSSTGQGPLLTSAHDREPSRWQFFTDEVEDHRVSVAIRRRPEGPPARTPVLRFADALAQGS